MPQYLDDRSAQRARGYRLEADLWDTLIKASTDTPALTVEDEVCALLGVAHRLTDQLRRGQATAPAVVDVPAASAGEIPAEWVAAFDQAVAAVGCGVCGSTQQCRCLVPDSKRPNKTAIGLAAVAPLITAAALEERADAAAAHR
jgi:hypothetical protein